MIEAGIIAAFREQPGLILGNHLKGKDDSMLANKTRKSAKRVVNYASEKRPLADNALLWPLLGFSSEGVQPNSMPVVDETPLEFFQKFYGPHGNPNWGQLDARGLAQIIIDADRRRAEFQKQMAANSLPSKEEDQTSRLPPNYEKLPAHTKSSGFIKDLLYKRLHPSSEPADEDALQQSDQKYYQPHQYPHREKELNPEKLEQLLKEAKQRRADIQAWLEENMPSEEEALQDSSPQPVATSNDDAAGPATRTPGPIEIENGDASTGPDDLVPRNRISIDESQENQFTTVKVSRGDNLSKIAKQNGITVADIMEANKHIKNANRIIAGQVIKIPKKINKNPRNVVARDGATVEPGPEEREEAMGKVQNGSDEVASGSQSADINSRKSASNNSPETGLANRIDYDFISKREGGRHTEAYVPEPEKSKSGVTIATGFDLGQRNENDLRKLGLSEELIVKVKPYLGMKGMVAEKFRLKNPLHITDAEATSIDIAVKKEEVEKIARNYLASPHNKDKKSFFSLPAEAQTVIASVAFQYGPALYKPAPTFWRHASSQNWKKAFEELMDFRDEHPTRRKKEAVVLGRLLK